MGRGTGSKYQQESRVQCGGEIGPGEGGWEGRSEGGRDTAISFN